MGLCVQYYGLQQLELSSFCCHWFKSEAINFCQWNQNGGSGKEKQTYVFWSYLCTQAVLKTIPWQSLGKGPASNHFPSGQPLGCLGTSLSGAKSVSPLCTYTEQQEAGTACFSCNRTGDPSAPALQRDSWGLLWSLATHIFPFCSPLATSKCPPRSSKHAMARGDMNQSQAHRENQQTGRDKGENSLGKATSPFQSTLGSKIQMFCSYLAWQHSYCLVSFFTVSSPCVHYSLLG